MAEYAYHGMTSESIAADAVIPQPTDTHLPIAPAGGPPAICPIA